MATEGTIKFKCPACSADAVPVTVTIETITSNPLTVMLTIPPLAKYISCEACHREVTGSVTLRRIPSSAPFAAIETGQNLKLVPRKPSLATSGGNEFDPA
jgi:hypothetical protein